MLRHINEFAWLLLAVAVLIGMAFFVVFLNKSASAQQEASAGAIVSTGLIAAYVLTRCVEKLTKSVAERQQPGPRIKP